MAWPRRCDNIAYPRIINLRSGYNDAGIKSLSKHIDGRVGTTGVVLNVTDVKSAGGPEASPPEIKDSRKQGDSWSLGKVLVG
jgi:hypothetical protein